MAPMPESSRYRARSWDAGESPRGAYARSHEGHVVCRPRSVRWSGDDHVAMPCRSAASGGRAIGSLGEHSVGSGNDRNPSTAMRNGTRIGGIGVLAERCQCVGAPVMVAAITISRVRCDAGLRRSASRSWPRCARAALVVPGACGVRARGGVVVLVEIVVDVAGAVSGAVAGS